MRHRTHSHLTLASHNAGPAAAPPLQWAHDIRNALATLGLYMETLERLAGPRGSKAASAAQALTQRTATMCTDAILDAGRHGPATRRGGLDLTRTIADIVTLLRPVAPDSLAIEAEVCGPCLASADATDVFRILFNIIQNAVAVARHGGPMSRISVSLSRRDGMIAVQISDDGPGIPRSVKAKLFRSQAAATGHGLAIARELAERNGGKLALCPSQKGTSFLLELPAGVAIELAPGAAMPSLGRRIAG